MTKTKSLIAAILFLSFLQLDAQRFVTVTDTISLNTYGYFNRFSRIWLANDIAKYRNYYFCAFYETHLYDYNFQKYHILAFSEDGTDVRKVELPERACSHFEHSDIFTRNDTLFLKGYYSSCLHYFFDFDNWEWVPLDFFSNVIYEDEIYSVIPYGWGTYTCFINKEPTWRHETRDGIQHTELTNRLYLYCNKIKRVIRKGNSYFIVHHYGADSLNLSKSPGNLIYVKLDHSLSDLSGRLDCSNNYKKNFIPIIRFSTKKNAKGWKKHEYDTTFNNAFLFDNQIFYVTSTPLSSSITKIEDGKLKTVVDFGGQFNFYILKNTGVNFANNKCITAFEQNANTYGFMDIADSLIHIRYFIHDQDSIKFIHSDSIQLLLQFLFANLPDINFHTLDSFENHIGAMCNNEILLLRNKYFPDKYQDDAKYGKISYYAKINDEQTLSCDYCINKSDSTVKALFLEWREPNLYDYRTNIYDNKFSTSKKHKIISIINKITGTTPKREKDCNVWIYNNLTCELYDNGRMVIY